MAWLTGWNYRKSHIIDAATGAGTLYQVPITVYYGSGADSVGNVYTNSHCNIDFSDIRFTSSDGETLLEYWIESQVNSNNAVIWVKITDSLESVNQTIYIYYGNAIATTTSDAKNTFIIGDDFNNGSLDASWVWTNQPTTPASWVESGTNLTINSGGQNVDLWNNTDTAYQLLQAITGDWESVLKVSCTETANYHTVGLLVKQDTNDWIDDTFQYNGSHTMDWDNNGTSSGNSVAIGSNPNTIWIKLQKVGNVYNVYYSLNGINWTYHTNYTKTMSPTNLGLFLKTATTTPLSGAFDFIYARKYVNPEPVQSTWGNEESELYVFNDIDTLISQLDLISTDDLDVMLSKIVTITNNMDTLLLKYDIIKTDSIDTLLQKLGLTLTDDIDSLFIKTELKVDNLDVILVKYDFIKTNTIDSLLIKFGITKNDSIDVLIKKISIISTNIIDFLVSPPIMPYNIDNILNNNIIKTKTIDVIFDNFLLKGRMNAAKESLINKIQTYDNTLTVIDAWRINKWDFDANTSNLVSIKIMPSRMNRLSYGSMITNNYFGQYYSYRFTLHILSKYDSSETIQAKTAMDIAKGIINYLRINQTDTNKGVLSILDITARESDPSGLTRGGAYMARIIVEGVMFVERPYKYKSEVA